MYKAEVESEDMPTPEIEKNPSLGPDLVQDDSYETVARAEVQPVVEVTLSSSEILKLLMFKPTYVRLGPLVVKVCRDREWYKVESGQKPESEDKDEQVENPTNQTLLENDKTEEEAQKEKAFEQVKNAHLESIVTSDLEVKNSVNL